MDVIVVGGGLAGLASATYLAAGRPEGHALREGACRRWAGGHDEPGRLQVQPGTSRTLRRGRGAGRAQGARGRGSRRPPAGFRFLRDPRRPAGNAARRPGLSAHDRVAFAGRKAGGGTVAGKAAAVGERGSGGPDRVGMAQRNLAPPGGQAAPGGARAGRHLRPRSGAAERGRGDRAAAAGAAERACSTSTAAGSRSWTACGAGPRPRESASKRAPRCAASCTTAPYAPSSLPMAGSARRRRWS